MLFLHPNTQSGRKLFFRLRPVQIFIPLLEKQGYIVMWVFVFPLHSSNMQLHLHHWMEFHETFKESSLLSAIVCLIFNILMTLMFGFFIEKQCFSMEGPNVSVIKMLNNIDCYFLTQGVNCSYSFLLICCENCDLGASISEHCSQFSSYFCQRLVVSRDDNLKMCDTVKRICLRYAQQLSTIKWSSISAHSNL